MAKFIGLETESNKLRNLDFLRFVASVGIVFHHSHEFFFDPRVRHTVALQMPGFQLFVELFFVISGFVMGFVYSSRIQSLSDYGGFLWRRVARLYPLHLTVLGLNIALWAILLTRGGSDTAPSFAPSCIISTALLIQEYVNCGSHYTFNGVTWSISIEMGLYVIFPILIFIGSRGKLALLVANVILLVSALYLLPSHGDWWQTPHIMRGLVFFCFGYMLFKCQKIIPKIPRSEILVLVLSAVAVIEMILVSPQPVILVTLAILATIAVSADKHDHVHFLVEKFSPLGQLTYSIYIWHILFVLALMNVVADKMFRGNLLVLAPITVVTYVSIFAASYLGYFAIEIPARRALIGLVRSAQKRFQLRASRPTGL